MDPDTRRLLLFAGGLATVLVVLIGASAMIGRRSGEVPVVSADPRPIRVKPDNPGGMKIDGAENDVFSGGSDTSNAKLAPPAETPDAKALRAGAVAAPVVQPPVVQPPPPMAASPPVKAASVAAAPAAAPVVPGKTPVPAEAATATAHPAAAGSHAVVQLAALASEEAARNEWQHLAKRMPELLSGRQPVFSRIERDGHVFWRVRTAGFADQAQARAFCDRVRGKGGGCSVADF